MDAVICWPGVFEISYANGSGLTFALVVVAEAHEEADSVPMPSLWVNYPSRLNTGFVKINLDGFLMHTFTINDQGATAETTGVLLERFLVTAGWYFHPSSDQSHYAVEVEGPRSVVTLDLKGVGSFFEKQAWLVPTVNADSRPEAALVVVHADGTLVQRVDDVQRIRVSEKQ